MGDDIRDRAEAVAQKFDEKWGSFRRFISENPLTGFWIGVGGGAAALIALRLVGRLLGFAASLIF